MCVVLPLSSKLGLVSGLTQRVPRSWSTSQSKLGNSLALHNAHNQTQEVTRVQRGDQGPDDTGDLPDNIQSFNSGASSSFNRIEHLRGPNVCRSGGQSACCSGWSQRGRSGLCLVPICKEGSCGQRGRCIKPGLCMCDGGNISPRCRGVSSEKRINSSKQIGLFSSIIPT